MNIGAIGDIHGRDDWKKIVKNPKIDLWVFIGDYFDSKYISYQIQMANFLDILEFKRSNPKKVILLFGNHDLHYLNIGEEYSGHQKFHAFDIGMVIVDAIRDGLVQVANLRHFQYVENVGMN